MITEKPEKGYYDNDYLAVSFISEKREGKRIKEDTFSLLDYNIKLVKDKKKGVIFSVMDGMGGQKGGYDASSFIQFKLPNFFRESKYQEKEGIELLLDDMHTEMKEKKEKDEMPETAGTTLSLIYMNNKNIHAFNIGDSAIFHYNTETEKLNEIFNNHNEDGIVTNYFGDNKLKYEIKSFNQNEGDLYLLCTDGLIESINTNIVEEIIKKHKYSGVEQITKKLYESSRRLGSKDDLTLIAIETIDLI
jgi:PPM family protein phosphatase